MTAVPSKDNPQETEQLKIVCQNCEVPGHVTSDCNKGVKKEEEQRKEPSFQNTKFWILKRLQLVHFSNEKITFQKSAGTELMPLTDLNSSNKTNQQTTGKKGNNKKNWPTQDLYQSLKILSHRKATTPVGRFYISERKGFICSNHNCVSLSWNTEH